MIDPDFVTSLYREPDAGGLAGWVSQLQAGMSREEIRQGFLASEEYQISIRRKNRRKRQIQSHKALCRSSSAG